MNLQELEQQQQAETQMEIASNPDDVGGGEEGEVVYKKSIEIRIFMHFKPAMNSLIELPTTL